MLKSIFCHICQIQKYKRHAVLSLWHSLNPVDALFKVQSSVNGKNARIFYFIFLLRRTHLVRITEVDLNTCLAPGEQALLIS